MPKSPASISAGRRPIARPRRVWEAALSASVCGLFFATAACGDAPTPDAPPCPRDVVERVQAWADRIDGFEADFEQTTWPVAFGGGPRPQPSVSRGHVWLARPGRMRWEYPESGALIVSDGSVIWIYDRSAGEAQRFEATAGYLDAAALQFLVSRARLEDRFEIRVAQCGADESDLELRPKEPASFDRVDLKVNTRSGALIGTALVDLLGNRTEMRFEGLASGAAPPDERFVFEVPEGVEVIEFGGVGPAAERPGR